ncbi:conserved hypothetical protein [delta proteobacterium NaphS2]|nr:conserved hypothetical protein [delta proteobacterium NaphS2]
MVWAAGASPVWAETSAVDPAAVEILKRMTDCLGTLKQFSVKTQNTIEDLTESGHRVDYDVSATVTVSRPNKLKAQRKGDLIDQTFYYNGKTLTLDNPSDKVYASQPAPATIEGMLTFARSSLGLVIPAADLIYRNNFKLLMQNVTLATVIGKEFIGGVRCDHLLFSRPGVDFQVCVADSGEPLPYKYVVTDTSTCALISISTVMSDWNAASAVDDAFFNFVPPKGVKEISFMPLKVHEKTDR